MNFSQFALWYHDKQVPTDRGVQQKKLNYQKIVKKIGSANSPKLSKKYRQNLQKKVLPIRPERNYQKNMKKKLSKKYVSALKIPQILDLDPFWAPLGPGPGPRAGGARGPGPEPKGPKRDPNQGFEVFLMLKHFFDNFLIIFW